MSIRTSLRGFVLCLMTLVPALTAAPANAAERLAWRFQEGDRFYATDETTVKMHSNDMDMEMRPTMISEYRVLKADGQETVVEQTIRDVRSDNPAADGFLQPWKGARFRMTFNSDKELMAFDGYEELLRRMSGGNADAEESLRRSMPEASLRRSLSNVFSFGLPGGDVSLGGSWEKSEPVDYLNGMPMQIGFRFRLDGPMANDASRQQISFTATVAGQQEKVTVEQFKGAVIFDTNRGRTESIKMTVLLSGEERGQKVKAEVSKVVTFSDDLPVLSTDGSR
jgi:hypothetical protein